MKGKIVLKKKFPTAVKAVKWKQAFLGAFTSPKIIMLSHFSFRSV